MLRSTFRRLVVPGERRFAFAGESPMGSAGGLPFYGNIYSGRVDSQNYVPPRQGGGTGLVVGCKSLWDDPVIQAKVQRCPYFALCDQVLFHNMDPSHLDPGLLTPQEHQLLLLFSRAYYEKWKIIHRRPSNAAPRIRIKYGSSAMLDELLELVECPKDARESLKLEYQVDDASIIAMEPNCWSTAYLDPSNMDHFTGRVLDFADVPKDCQQKIFTALDQMRRLRILRRDQRHPTGEENELIVPFHYGVTLFDLYKYLGLKPYSGQLKVYNYVDLDGTPRVVTLDEEDTYFDFLLALFYRADLRSATLSALADEKDCTCRYTITVEPFTTDERRAGTWL
eukprot:gene7269-5115_t